MSPALATPAEVQLEIVAERKELLQALTAVIGIVERRTTIPILNNLLLETSGDGFLLISATNLSQSVKTSIPVKVRGEGSVTVPARKLYEYVKLLAGEEVSIRQEENNWVHLRCGRSKTKMVGMDRNQFPAIPAPTGQGTEVSASTLLFLIQKAIVSVAEEESRFMLNAARLRLNATSAEMVSTDGHRLTLVSKSEELPSLTSTWEMLIPAAALVALRSLLGNTDRTVQSVTLWETATTLFFHAGETSITSQKLSGQFPNVEAVVPVYSDPGVMLDITAVTAPLARCLLFSEHETSAVALKLSASELVISSAAKDLGQTEETIEIYGGPEKPLTIGFNGGYLKEFFGMTTEPVGLQVRDEKSAALFYYRNDEGFTVRHVLMPLALRGGK